MLIFLSLRHFKKITNSKEPEKRVTFAGPSAKQERTKESKLLARLVDLLKLCVFEMHSYDTPLAPFVKEVLEYLVRAFVGEESGILLSDNLLEQTEDETLELYLKLNTFLRNNKQFSD